MTLHVAVVRRCAGAPALASFSGLTPRDAVHLAWRYCFNTKTHGFKIELESRNDGRTE